MDSQVKRVNLISCKFFKVKINSNSRAWNQVKSSRVELLSLTPQQVSYYASQLVEKFLTPQQVSHHDLHGFQWNRISESWFRPHRGRFHTESSAWLWFQISEVMSLNHLNSVATDFHLTIHSFGLGLNVRRTRCMSPHAYHTLLHLTEKIPRSIIWVRDTCGPISRSL